MTIRVTINGKVNPSTWDAMTQFLTLNLPSQHFTGNQRVSVLYDNTNNELLLDEVWASVEAHQAYLASIAQWRLSAITRVSYSASHH